MEESFSNTPEISLDEQKEIADVLAKQIGGGLDDEMSAIIKDEDTVDVSEARSRERMLEVSRDRSKTRVLFITDEAQSVDPGSTVWNKLEELGLVFEEVHCIVIHSGKGDTVTGRISGNVYLYRVFGSYWWTQIRAVKSLVKDQLVFGGIPRPDCVVSLSPYVAGMAAHSVSRLLKRPWQLHLSSDPYDVAWLQQDKKNKSLKKTANYVLKRVTSVRTLTEHLTNQVNIRFKHIADITTLPHFYNYSAYVSGEPTFSVHEKYTDYSFIILTEAEYSADSALHDTITSLMPILRNPRIGLVVIGEGKSKQLFVEKARLLRIERSIVFLSKPVDSVSLYKTADMFISTDTSPLSEEYLLRAVGASLPICAYSTPLREDLMKDNESAFLVEPRDSFALGKQASKLINTPGLRTQFSRRMADLAKYRLHEDRGEYLLALRDTIESMFLQAGNDTKKSS